MSRMSPADWNPPRPPLLDATAGLAPGELGVVLGAPEVGKSTLLLQLAAGRLSSGASVFVASGGTSRDEVGLHLLARLANVPLAALRAGEVSRQEMTNLLYGARWLRDGELGVDDRLYPSARELAGGVDAWRAARASRDLMIVVDDVDHLRRERADDPPAAGLADAALVLRDLARRAGARVLVTATGAGEALATGPLAALAELAALVAVLSTDAHAGMHRLALLAHPRVAPVTHALRLDPARGFVPVGAR